MSSTNELQFLSNRFSEDSKKVLRGIALRKEKEILEKIREIFLAGNVKERFSEVEELYAFYDVIKTQVGL